MLLKEVLSFAAPRPSGPPKRTAICPERMRSRSRSICSIGRRYQRLSIKNSSGYERRDEQREREDNEDQPVDFFRLTGEVSRNTM